MGTVNLAPVVFRTSSIGTDDTDYNVVVIVTFNRAINSPGADYSAGVTIEVNALGATISSAVLQAGGKSVYYTLSLAVDSNDVITWAYSAAGGDIEDAADNTITLANVAAQTAFNGVGTQLWFDHFENSSHIVTIGV